MFRRTTTHLLTSLLVVTVIASLLGAGWKLASYTKADSGSATTEQAVDAFYEGINQTIRTGNSEALTTVVAPDVVVHGPLASLAQQEEGLTRYLTSLHRTSPKLRLTVTEVVVTDDQALVNLTVQGDDHRTFLGSQLNGVAPWGGVDAVRVRNGQISEYWSGGTGLDMLEPLAQAPLTILPGGEPSLTLDRLTLPPAGSFAAASLKEKRWLFVQSGTVVVNSTRRESTKETVLSAPIGPVEPDDGKGEIRNPATTKTGDFFELPLFSKTEIRNTGSSSASLLVFAVGTPDPLGDGQADPAGHSGQAPVSAELSWPGWGTSAPRVSENGATLVSLTGTVQPALPAERSILTVGSVTLAPGAELVMQPTGPFVLAVDDGLLDVVSEGLPAWIYDGSGSELSVGTVHAGGGAILASGAVVSLRNLSADPASITMFAIVPVSALTGGAA
jgi:hypothetical protein